MVVRLVQIVDIHRVANKKEVVIIINNTGFDIFKKHDNLTVDGVDFWSPHPHNKGGRGYTGVLTRVLEILI